MVKCFCFAGSHGLNQRHGRFWVWLNLFVASTSISLWPLRPLDYPRLKCCGGVLLVLRQSTGSLSIRSGFTSLGEQETQLNHWTLLCVPFGMGLVFNKTPHIGKTRSHSACHSRVKPSTVTPRSPSMTWTLPQKVTLQGCLGPQQQETNKPAPKSSDNARCRGQQKNNVKYVFIERVCRNYWVHLGSEDKKEN